MQIFISLALLEYLRALVRVSVIERIYELGDEPRKKILISLAIVMLYEKYFVYKYNYLHISPEAVNFFSHYI